MVAKPHVDRGGLTVIPSIKKGLQVLNQKTSEWVKLFEGGGVIMVGKSLADDVDSLTPTKHRVFIDVPYFRRCAVFFFDKSRRKDD